MKKYLFSLFVVLAFCFSTNAQKRKGHKEKIKLLKISYLTEQLDLTSSEAEKFWPVYNEHSKNILDFMAKKSDAIKKELRVVKEIDSIDEKKALTLFNLTQYLERKKFEERENYIKKLKTILPIKKILKLQIAEKEFGRKLMRKYRHKNNKGQ
ncbi:sensor of ECF-type sigma factor [Polaribacter sp.]|jgi:ribosomal protein L11 methylase PrmA|nr:sensor of ECF-type sigma factor [Polaribacter sp.]MDB0026341.1 sensor of ECF-type sigma factor [Polaribacter sp.]MDB4167703.1 sensor of ECF-type sigma factor [Polaribacter sp.]MDB4202253.1 sensor of ECF-type sigma factor [Polaribacter sp.]MDB9778049.1 sensor of ECF-type sigma factor [Polaribacter sp.]